jgi:hypothetical protein
MTPLSHLKMGITNDRTLSPQNGDYPWLLSLTSKWGLPMTKLSHLKMGITHGCSLSPQNDVTHFIPQGS